MIGSDMVRLLELSQAACVERHQTDDPNSERYECEIEHESPPSATASYPAWA